MKKQLRLLKALPLIALGLLPFSSEGSPQTYKGDACQLIISKTTNPDTIQTRIEFHNFIISPTLTFAGFENKASLYTNSNKSVKLWGHETSELIPKKISVKNNNSEVVCKF